MWLLTFATGMTAACSAPQTLELPTVLGALESRYGPNRVESTLEVLPPLAPYLEEPGAAGGTAAAERHFATLSPESRQRFASQMSWTFVYRDLLQLLGADLPNGFHDAAFVLAGSQELYDPILGLYGLTSEEATPYDVASSLSSHAERSIAVAVAWYVAGLPDEARADYLQRFVDRVREVRSADAP